jgi:hypothetical protein
MAARYFRNTGSTAWNLGTNWSATDGGASVGAFPTVADDVFVTSNSGNLAVNVASACLSINFTGYVGTLSGASNLTVSGNVTFSSGMTQSYTGNLTVNATATLTSNGKTIIGNLVLSNGVTFTLADNWTVNGVITSSGAAKVLNGANISANGITMTGALSGTTNITLTGGSWTGTTQLSTNVNFTGNVTFAPSILYGVGILKYISGTPVVAGSTLTLNAGCTLDTAGMTFNQITVSANVTITINSLLTLVTLSLTNTAITFAGTAGFDTQNFNVTSASSGVYNFILQSGVTYRVRTLLSLNLNPSNNPKLIRASTPGVMANFKLDVGATCNVGIYDFTDINASSGRYITGFQATVTNCINIFGFADPLQSLSKSFA